jgi:hypothetical protein
MLGCLTEIGVCFALRGRRAARSPNVKSRFKGERGRLHRRPVFSAGDTPNAWLALRLREFPAPSFGLRRLTRWFQV